MSTRSITPALAHVTSEANLLVREVRPLDAPDTYRSVFAIDGTHPYLYENPAIANHVSGTTFVDMGRQMLKAITHLFYGAAIDSRFVLHDINLSFARWARLGVDIEATVEVRVESANRPEALRRYQATLTWAQEGRTVARATSSFSTLSAELEAKLMGRQYAQGPAKAEAAPLASG